MLNVMIGSGERVRVVKEDKVIAAAAIEGSPDFG